VSRRARRTHGGLDPSTPTQSRIILAIITLAVGEVAAALSLPVPPDLTGKVVLLTPDEAKGLEFDVVVIADPAAVLAAGRNDLYVAMTRATRTLGVVHTGPVPPELSSLTVR
jgi:superfamily I DNA/RNA helicase